MPVVTGQGMNSSAAQNTASIKNTPWFDKAEEFHFHTTRLTINNRLVPGQEDYRLFCKQIGTGFVRDPYNRVQIPEQICVANQKDLFDFVFPQEALANPMEKGDLLTGCAVLCPTNAQMFEAANYLRVNFENVLHLKPIFFYLEQNHG